ncbi:brevican core protein-like [Antedon mediterranea]|uniref:brevican core protein-like n=1 Tax=Antedon mediterranea TaxID=105859 RepID=UPI003AF7A24B
MMNGMVMNGMVMNMFFVFCFFSAIKAQTDTQLCEPNNKFVKTIHRFLKLLSEDERELKHKVNLLADVVDKLDDLVVNLTQEDTRRQVLKKLDELETKVDHLSECTCSKLHDRVFHLAVGGTYKLNFADAQQACLDNNATIATPSQLQAAYMFGLDYCAAGWLSDGSVQYPITMPRQGCDQNSPPGLRHWGFKDKSTTYDVYCYDMS